MFLKFAICFVFRLFRFHGVWWGSLAVRHEQKVTVPDRHRSSTATKAAGEDPPGIGTR